MDYLMNSLDGEAKKLVKAVGSSNMNEVIKEISNLFIFS